MSLTLISLFTLHVLFGGPTLSTVSLDLSSVLVAYCVDSFKFIAFTVKENTDDEV